MIEQCSMNMFSKLHLTFTTTSFRRAKWVIGQPPKSKSSDRLHSAGHVEVTPVTATVDEEGRVLSSTIAVVIVAIVGARRGGAEVAW